MSNFIFIEKTCKSTKGEKMTTDFIKQIEKIYMEKMQNMIKETMNSSLQSGRIWQKKKETIAMDIGDCFNHLIIPDDVLKKSLQSNQYRQFENIQIEIIEELEKILSTEIDNVLKEQISCVTELEKDIASLKQEFNETETFNYTTKNNTLFISNNYLKERLNFLRKILEHKIPANFSLKQYNLLIEELNKQNILTDSSIQKAKKDLKKKEVLLQRIYKIYDKIVKLKYVLSFHINPEIIFALGFVDNKLFSKAETLHRIVLCHTQLFKDMIQELPFNLRQYFSLNNLYSQVTIINDDKQIIDTDVFIYQRISDLDDIYFAQKQQDGLYLYNSDIFKKYWQMLRLVYKQTRLIFPDIIPKKYTKTDIYINLMGISNGDVAKIFNMSEATFSRKKNNAQKVTPHWALLLENFLDFHSNCLKGITTIPLLGYDTNYGYLIPIVSIYKNNAFATLQAVKIYIMKQEKNLKEQSIKNNYSYLLKHLNILITNIEYLKEDDFNALEHFLRMSIK